MSRSAHAAADVAAGGIRARILDAAMAILHEDGIQGLSQVQVARRAKVRQSHLTYYFPKRHDLVEAVSARFVDGIVRGFGTAAGDSSKGDPGEALRRMARTIADEGHMRMFTGVIVEADGDPELRAMLVRLARSLQATLADRLGGDDAMERARLVLASLWGIGLHDFVMRPKRGSPLIASFLTAIAGATAAPRRGARKRTR